MKSKLLKALLDKFASTPSLKVATVDVTEVAMDDNTTQGFIELVEANGFRARVTTNHKDQICVEVSRR